MWMILAVMGALIQLGFGFINRTHSAPGTFVRGSIEFIVVSAVLISAIPFAVKISHELGLPGGPLITAKLNGEEQPYRWSLIVLGGVLWSVVGMVTIFVGQALFIVFILRPTVPAHPIHHTPIVRPSASWLVFKAVMSSISAGVQEEILFRFILIGVFSWALMFVSRSADRRPTRTQLWLAIIVQAYCFGAVHRRPGSYLAGGIFGVREIGILVLPQTWAGVFFGLLYVERDLETSIVAHTFWDLIWNLFWLPFRMR
jgi:membrane protease YdiL (CAAX protease family)